MSVLAVDDRSTAADGAELRLVVNPAEISVVAMDHYADLLTALSLGPLSRPFANPDGGLRFEWKHLDVNGGIWNLAAVIEASGGLYMVALSPNDAAEDDEVYLERFDAMKLIRFVTAGNLISLK